MAVHPLLPDPTVLTLDSLCVHDGVIVFAARAMASGTACPCCGWMSERVHSRYRRTLLDLPWQGNAVRIVLSVRKFFCDNRDCARRVFAERLPTVAQRYARKTGRLADVLRELAYLAGGEAAARIARTLGLLISPDALLEGLKKAPPVSFATPRVLGIDDFAFCKGHTYGTILVDQERRCPIDLLPDREASTVAAWLKAHPGVEIVTRDRASGYADGINKGAPEALQVSDRWHLLKNLGDALERLTHRFHAHVRVAAQALEQSVEPALEPIGLSASAAPSAPSGRAATDAACRRERRRDRFEQVKDLQAQGLSLREIARRTGQSRNTIRKQARCDALPESARRPARPGKIAPFATYLHQRWQEGVHNATLLHQEIQKMGFCGQVCLVQRHVQAWREKPRRRVTASRAKPPSPRQVACLVGRPEERLKEKDQRFLWALLSACPDLALAREQALEFGRLLRERDVGALNAWRAKTSASGVMELVSFSESLEHDLAAVEAGLSVEWSNGPVEGQVNRLKFVKRSMYGRGSFALLRARVLHRPAA